MSHEVWEEYYDRLAALIQAHRTTLVFVNTRRLAERVARHLSERLGEDPVTAHHGSLSKETRLDAEHRLKTGALKALVATASLELGIDIGHVDLVCQIGSPHRIATLLQRVGRSGHTIAGVPKGRLFPMSRDDLIECAALLRAVRRGELDAIVIARRAARRAGAADRRRDGVRASTARTSCSTLVRRAWPYRDLPRARVRRGASRCWPTASPPAAAGAPALLHRDEVHGMRARAGAARGCWRSPPAARSRRSPTTASSLDPDDTFVGTLNEDFAIESTAGDIFQLGNASWQILQVVAGTVRVADAHGAPPTIPFWLGEAPARSDELSQRGVSDCGRRPIDCSAEQMTGRSGRHRRPRTSNRLLRLAGRRTAWLDRRRRAGGRVPGAPAGARSASIPTQETLVLERFFDESGGMQLVLHAPFGSRINKAWALALRKRFCRQFNFELQAAATEDALLLSLGPQHSFPLADVFRYLHPATVRDILVQAFLDAPVFETRWRWNATISLAVPRNRGGRKVPPQLQRMHADDLMAAVFPDAAACLENIPGDREMPDHPLVNQTVRDCLEEAMDLPGLIGVLSRIHAGELRLVSRDTPEPSVFAHEILNARPYAFLDDAPLEERRTHAVPDARRRATGGGRPRRARCRGDRPRPRRGAAGPARRRRTARRAADRRRSCTDDEAPRRRCRAGARQRASRADVASAGVWVAAERLPELLALHPDAVPEPPIAAPASRAARAWTREAALRRAAARPRDRRSARPRRRARRVAAASAQPRSTPRCWRSKPKAWCCAAAFTPARRQRHRREPGRTRSGATAGCSRASIATRSTGCAPRSSRSRRPTSCASCSPGSTSTPHSRLTGADGLRAVIAQLDGLELPARAWERDVLPARVDGYEPSMLDMLCLTGDVGWARLSSGPTQVVGATPIALFLREQADAWPSLRVGTGRHCRPPRPRSPATRRWCSRTCGRAAPRSATTLARAAASSDDRLRAALGELVAPGLVSSDGFAGLRADRSPAARRTRVDAAGRTCRAGGSSVCRSAGPAAGPARARTRRHARDAAIEALAWTLLRRYGVVFRRLLAREATSPPGAS